MSVTPQAIFQKANRERWKKKDSPRPVGRPSLYRKEYEERAYKLCLLGAIDSELADFFGVCTTTIDTWKHEHPEFLVALKKGKTFADANVAESLYKRAIGCSHTESHVSNFKGDIAVTNITKNYPPDTGAAFIWLKNRQPQKWNERAKMLIRRRERVMGIA